MQLCDLMVELSQLREMFLAIESTQVAKQYQNRRAAEQPACCIDFAADCQEVEVEIDAHPIIMKSPVLRFVICITVEQRHLQPQLRVGGEAVAFGRSRSSRAMLTHR